MTSEPSDLSIFQEVCDAAGRGDAGRVNVLLECTQYIQSSLDDNLLSSTTRAKYLQRLLLSFSPDASKSSILPTFSLEEMLRALLMVPACYETPWIICCDLVSKFQGNPCNFERSVYLSCIADIHIFLQQAVPSWRGDSKQPEVENNRSLKLRATENLSSLDQRFWIPRLAQLITDPLLCEPRDDDCSGIILGNGRETFCLELVTTILSISRALDSTLYLSVLDTVFHRQIHPKRILSWLTLASEATFDLRENDYKGIRQTLLHLFGKEPIDVPQRDLPSITSVIVALALSSDMNSGDTSGEVIREWQRIILYILGAAASDMATYSAVEDLLVSNLASLSSKAGETWMRALVAIEADGKVPGWLWINMMLILFQSMHQSVSQRLPDGVLSTTIIECHRIILERVFPKCLRKTEASKSGNESTNNDDMHEVQRVVDGLTYVGGGRFVRRGRTDATQLSTAGVAICQSLFLGRLQPTHSPRHVHAIGRATWWNRVAESLSTEFQGALRLKSIIFAILTLTTVYCEMPEARKSLLRSITRHLVADCGSGDRLSELDFIYCVSLSIIASSISENDRGIDGLDEMKPVCDLFERPLPKTIFFKLCSSLSSLPPARVAMLSASQKYLESTVTFWWAYRDKRVNSESKHKIYCGLFGLCELVKRDDWGDCEIEAWRLLSDVLVLNKPQLPVEARSWLYGQLKDLITHNELSAVTAGHFLRATIVRSFLLFEKKAPKSIYFSPEKAFVAWADHNAPGKTQAYPLEDIVELNRLLVSLLEYNTSKGQSSDRESSLFTRGCDAFIDIVSAHRENPTGSRRRTMKKFWDENFSEDCNDFDLSCCVAMRLQSHLLEYVLSLRTESTKAGWVTSKNNELQGLNECISDLLQREAKALHSVSLDASDDILPCWVGKQPQRDFASKSRGAKVEQSVLAPINHLLCDLMTDLVIHTSYPVAKVHAQSHEDHRRILFALNRIFESKQSIVGKTHSSKADVSSVLMDRDTMKKTASQIFLISAEVMKNVTLHGWDPIETEEVVAPIMEFCSSFHHSLQNDEVKGNARSYMPDISCLMTSIWQLYLATADETASVRLLSYLEDRCLNDKKNEPLSGQREEHDYSLHSIRTGEDVDIVVRCIRFRILRALHDCSSLALTEHAVLSTSASSIDHDVVSDIEGRDSGRRIVSSNVLAGCLRNLTRDLRSGLDGCSGGITAAIYVEYVATVDNCAALIRKQAEAPSDRMTLRSFFSACVEASDSIKTILCNFPLETPTIFKRSFMLSSSILPLICRHIYRERFFLSASSSLPDSDKLQIIYETIVSGAFSDCMKILERWSGLRDPSTAPWTDIAGPDHTSNGNDADVEMGHSSRLNDSTVAKDGTSEGKDVPSIVVVPSEERKIQSSGRDIPRTREKLQLPSKDTWSWAFQCLFLTLEEMWDESSQIMDGSDRRNPNRIALGFTHQSIRYYRERQQELSSSIRNVCLLLRSSSAAEKEKKQAGKQLCILEVFAMYLPGNLCATGFCFLLGRISEVLDKAFKLLFSHLDGSAGDTPAGENDLALIESVSCISAWLCLDPCETDFIVGTTTWYSIEKRKDYVKSSKSPGKSADQGIVERLSKVVIKCDKVDMNLQILKAQLSEISIDSSAMPLVKAIDGLFEGDAEENFRLLHLATEKLRVIEENAPRHLLDVPLDSENGEVVGKRKLKLDEVVTKAPKQRRKATVRSRNKVVDKWLNLDQVIGDNGEAVGTDAYVDLEDFLVDG
jgi:hypothetical protein